MTEIETLAKLFGIPGAMLGFGIWTVKTLAPIWAKHLEENADSLKGIAKSMNMMAQWQRTIDARLKRIETITDEATENVRILFERLGQQKPSRFSDSRRDSEADRE